MNSKKIVSKPTLAGGSTGGASALAGALAVLLVLLPAVPVPAAATPGSETIDRFAADDDSLERAVSAARFRRVGARQLMKGRNGIKLTTALGRWRVGSAGVRGAKVKVESPWGEELNVDLFLHDSGMLAEFNGRIQVLTTFDAERNPHAIHVTVDGRTTTSHLGNRARLFAAGAPLPHDMDSRAHQALALALQEELSPAFLREIGNIDRPAQQAGCTWELISCAVAFAVWVIDVALLPAACLVGGVPTFGISCALAIVGHELASASIALSCGQYASCRNNENTPPEEPDEVTPIIIDMDGRGFRLTGLDDPVVFDLTADGIPERVSWTSRDGDEAFLVFDRNQNGRIDDGSELFGSRTPLVDGALAEHGFIPLTEYDLRPFGGNQNGLIDPGDLMYGRLMLWNDRNRDGISDFRELRSLRRAGVVALSLDYKVDDRRDRHGNRFVVTGEAFVRVRGQQQARAMSDVYLRILE